MSWRCKTVGPYLRSSDEAKENARAIWGVLGSRGWTLNAVCGVLGNIGAESGYNPWRWQSDKVGTSSGSPWKNKGYGLTQFTPASKYIDSADAKAIPGYGPNFSDKAGSQDDGYAQMIYLDEHADYYPTGSYPMSYAEYKVSEENPGELAVTWLYNYERPADPGATEDARRENGNYWYEVLAGEPPVPPTPGGESKYLKYLLFLWEVTHYVR